MYCYYATRIKERNFSKISKLVQLIIAFNKPAMQQVRTTKDGVVFNGMWQPELQVLYNQGLAQKPLDIWLYFLG